MAYDPHGTRLGGTDNRFLTLLARHGKLSRDQVDAHVYGTRDRATNHIGRLRRMGLIWTTDTPSARRFYALTADGVKAARPMLTVPFDPPDDSPYEPDLHDLAVTDWCLRWTAEKGLPLLTKREIRWLATRPEDAEFAVEELGATSNVQPIEYLRPTGERVINWVATSGNGAASNHRPDAITVSPDGLYCAVEIETTPGKTSELHSILRAYADGSPFDRVVYYGTPAVLNRLEAAAARLDTGRPASEWLLVEPLTDITCEWIRRRLWDNLHFADSHLTMSEWRQISGGDPYTP